MIVRQPSDRNHVFELWSARGPRITVIAVCCRRLLSLALILLAPLVAAGNEASAGFEAANKLYEQGKYREAATAYEKIANVGSRAEALYFNLGNAWFKAGQTGRAIAAWREAEAISPRDPGVRFNLSFARKQVTGSEATAASPPWQRGLRALTLNEWAVLASIALWLWFLLLTLREFRPALRPALSGYTAAAGGVLLLLAACFGAAASLQLTTMPAVTIVPETLARSGPLDEAKVLHQFRDGTELTVLDRKEIAGDTTQSWLQVRDAAGRTGWVKGDSLVTLRSSARKT